MRPHPTNMVWSVIAAVLLLLGGGTAAGFAGREGANFMFDLEQTEPTLARFPPMRDPPEPRLSQRVVIAIVDGLRLDTSRELGFLGRLRAEGVDAEAQSQYPTWSKPNYVNILTGVPPTASGVRTNRYPGTVRLDSLMDRVRDAGMHAGFVGDNDPMPRLFLRSRGSAKEPAVVDYNLLEEGKPEAAEAALMAELRGAFDDARYAPWPGGFRDGAEQVLAVDDALVVLLIGVVDGAGHAYGADSDEYRQAAQLADVTLEHVLSSIDLTQDTVIVVADHGHTDRGGHGGVEPEVVRVPLILVGAGIDRDGQVIDAKLQDVAPTVARLLGVSPPGHGLGRSLVEVLAFDDATRTRIAGHDETRARRNGGIVSAGIYQARQARLEKRAIRLGVVILGALVVLGIAWYLRAFGGIRLDWKSLVLGVPVFFGVYYILIAVLGQQFSPSLLPAQGDIGRELLKYGLAATLVQLGAGWLALRRKLSLADRLAAANGIALVGLVVAMLPVAVLWTVFPAPYVEVPGPTLLVLIPAVQVSVACYAVGVALTLLVEVMVFLSRAVDPRVRALRLEKALSRARELAAMAESGEWPPRRVRRRRDSADASSRSS